MLQLNTGSVTIRLVEQREMASAVHLSQISFARQLGIPTEEFRPGATWDKRWHVDKEGIFGAWIDGELVGVCAAVAWGSFGFFGPLVVHPARWDQGIGQLLLDRVMEYFERKRVSHAGLYTFSTSPKHIALYQKYGFWPRFLTANLSKESFKTGSPSCILFSQLDQLEQVEQSERMKALTDSIHDGLDLSREVRSVNMCGIGDTVVISDNAKVVAFAVCHFGEGSEAEPGKLYIKFGAAQNKNGFKKLLHECEKLASFAGLSSITCSVNTARTEAYSFMLENAFRIDSLGIAMQKPNEPGFNRAGAFVIDDWR